MRGKKRENKDLGMSAFKDEAGAKLLKQLVH